MLLPYVKYYVNTFTGKSISAIEWKDNLYGYFQKNNPEKVKLLDTIDWQVCHGALIKKLLLYYSNSFTN